MANLQEKPVWETGIYQLETSDPVLAGPDGIDNLQGKQLANRTAYLKKQLDELAGGASTAAYAAQLRTARQITLTGDGSWNVAFDGSGDASAALTLANSGVKPGSYAVVTVDVKGRVTAGRQLSAADFPALDWSKLTSTPTTLAGYGIADAAWRDAERRVWGAAFRANKGDPADAGADTAAVGYGFDVDGDTGLFAAKSASPGSGSAKLMLKIDNLECLTIGSDGALRSSKYGWLHECFAAQASTLAGYGIVDGASKSDLATAVAHMGELFPGQVAPRGHRKYPDGLVEQWFSVPFNRRDQLIPFVFPLAMAEVYGVWPSVLDAEGEVTALLASVPTSTGGTIRTRGIYGGPPDEGTIFIRVIGKL
ncbi:hypothetical protein [Chromobacterium subtsugae]|uniref:hypothetical protein n=1 Tax=Chromobacterium subtsugae TaxID=251747 RepID=UPI00069B6552|nr:hypothetical protein [Chromobacterium subtsugae]